MRSDQRISAIETQKKDPNRRSIYINGKFVLGMDALVVQALRLKVGQQINEEDLLEMTKAEMLSKAKQKAFRLLEYRPRSRRELSQRLKQVGYDEQTTEEALERLEEMGYVDDEQFAKMWVNHRLSGKATGKSRIRLELRQKGVEAETIEEALLAVDAEEEYESAMNMARKRWERDNSENPKKRRKLAEYLRRKGFDWDVIKKILEELDADNEVD